MKSMFSIIFIIFTGLVLVSCACESTDSSWCYQYGNDSSGSGSGGRGVSTYVPKGESVASLRGHNTNGAPASRSNVPKTNRSAEVDITPPGAISTR
jgi:hypothetical protein